MDDFGDAAPDIFERLFQGGDVRQGGESSAQAIKADDGYILRYAEALTLQGIDDIDRYQIVEGAYGGRDFRQHHQALGRLDTAFRLQASFHEQFLIRHDSSVTQGVKMAIEMRFIGAAQLWTGGEGDPAVAQVNQMLCGEIGSAIVVGHDGRHSFIGDITSDDDEGESVLHEPVHGVGIVNASRKG